MRSWEEPIGIPQADIPWIKHDKDCGLFNRDIATHKDIKGNLKMRREQKNRMWFYPPEPPGYVDHGVPNAEPFFRSRLFVWRPVGLWKYKLKCPNGVACAGKDKDTYLIRSGFHSRVYTFLYIYTCMFLLWMKCLRLHRRKKITLFNILDAIVVYNIGLWYCRYVTSVMCPVGTPCWQRCYNVMSAKRQLLQRGKDVKLVSKLNFWHGITLSSHSSVQLTKPCFLLSWLPGRYAVCAIIVVLAPNNSKLHLELKTHSLASLRAADSLPSFRRCLKQWISNSRHPCK